jgi:hypothetical protein
MPRDALPITPHRTAGLPIAPQRAGTDDRPAPRAGTADRPRRMAGRPITPRRMPDHQSARAHRTADHPAPDGRAAGMPRTACLTDDPAGSGGHASVRARDRRAARAAVSGCRATRDSPAVRSGGQVAEWPARSQVTSHAVRHRQAVQSGGRAFRLPRGARSSRRPIAGRVAVRRTPTTSTDPPTRPGNPTRRPDQATRPGNPRKQPRPGNPGKQLRPGNPGEATRGSNPGKQPGPANKPPLGACD